MILTRQSVIFAVLIVGALVVEVAILVWFFDGRSEDEPLLRPGTESSFGDTAACGEASPSSAPPSARFDEAKRFAVEVPPTWMAKANGGVITLTKKNGRATLSVGRARPGDLLMALQDLRASLRRSYRDLEVTSVKLRTLNGCPARSVEGRARNRRGADLNFEALVVAGPADNFVIAGFLERGAEPSLDAKVERVIRSVSFYLSEEDRARS